ncbi:hypothetical protein BIV57_15910 [Mangrovactinospora gilvigrisea]|uniref:Helix-turn-helix domain-containing protein n=1 Tax=Mangrovactinospora gilvigrisea TaxID=1428644 RepID=A0A1J7BD48_9ACTN|nr:hypothetical protein [Mangrovactinospora gilvigrisea]OIV36509.1 hypothetical protein BIV57_15910 [Mangrovactinospora gilvigrisea]
MHIRHTAHTHAFTVIPNAIARHPRLSLTAVGLLARLLSLPDGTRETIHTLAEKVSEGRLRVRKAFSELEREGYLTRTRMQDPDTGLWHTEVTVTDVPNDQSPDAGGPGAQAVGRSPKGERTKGKNHPPQPATDPPGLEGEGSGAGSDAGPTAAVLHRVGRAEPRLRLSPGEVLAVAPLAAQWLANGATSAELHHALTAGLPARVHAPARFIANRLERKMPQPRPAVRPLGECADCRMPLAREAEGARCGRCDVSPPAASVSAAPAAEGRRLLEAIRQRRMRRGWAPGAHPLPA